VKAASTWRRIWSTSNNGQDSRPAANLDLNAARKFGEQDLRLDNRAVLSRSSEDALAFGTPIRSVADQHLREQPIAEGVFGIRDCRHELVVCSDRLGVSFER
jgi:hypothetical protein